MGLEDVVCCCGMSVAAEYEELKRRAGEPKGGPVFKNRPNQGVFLGTFHNQDIYYGIFDGVPKVLRVYNEDHPTGDWTIYGSCMEFEARAWGWKQVERLGLPTQRIVKEVPVSGGPKFKHRPEQCVFLGTFGDSDTYYRIVDGVPQVIRLNSETSYLDDWSIYGQYADNVPR